MIITEMELIVAILTTPLVYYLIVKPFWKMMEGYRQLEKKYDRPESERISHY